MSIYSQFAAAKINLTLAVLGRRHDGYHELRSLIVFADIGDQLTLDTERPVGVSVAGPFAHALDGENLVAKALALVQANYPQARLGHVDLQKNLPVAAGIGGGSADAAAALRLIARANDPDLAATIDWQRQALALGADVPVCLAGIPAMVSGLGDVVAPLGSFPELPAILVNPQVRVPNDKTASIFRALAAPLCSPQELAAKRAEAARAEAAAKSLSMERRLTLVEAVTRIGRERNDLQPICQQLIHAIGDVIAALENSGGCRLARLSGAGPTCFGLYESAEAAAEAAAELAGAHPSWWVRAVALRGCGPGWDVGSREVIPPARND